MFLFYLFFIYYVYLFILFFSTMSFIYDDYMLCKVTLGVLKGASKLNLLFIYASKRPGSTENVLDSTCAKKPGPLLKSIMTSALLKHESNLGVAFQRWNQSRAQKGFKTNAT